MASAPRRVSQPVDGRGNAVTNFAEGTIARHVIPVDGKWHAFPVEGGVRVHVWPSRKGVIYTTSMASPAVDLDDVADHVETSIPLAAGAAFQLSFDGTLFLAADPDAGGGAAPLVALMRSPGVA